MSSRHTEIQRRGLFASPLLLAPFALGQPALAQDFPARPLRLLVPFAPGGFTDILARYIADQLGRALGQPVVVENRPGAGGSIAAEQVAKAAPDGHTLLLASVAVFAINPALYPSLPYDPAALALVDVVATQPNILLANPASGIGSVPELIAAAKAKPGTIAYASNGNGSVTHLTMAMLAAEAGIELLHVPYRGSAPGLVDLVAGRVQVMFDGAGTALPQVAGGAARAIGLSWDRRLAELPDVPPISATLPGFDMSAWFALAGHAGMPGPVMTELRRAVGQILASEPFLRLLKERQAEPVRIGGADLPAFVAAERGRWAEAVRRSGARVE
ncbi:MAG: tripartite tricarboxylate transporter substrate binding protein [Acetobacteraceae bacterium]|nr:tripartite tricarboxylate transporter substrate binding protein [Acetobacteraceae bacterium]